MCTTFIICPSGYNGIKLLSFHTFPVLFVMGTGAYYKSGLLVRSYLRKLESKGENENLSFLCLCCIFSYLGYCIIATYSGSAGASVREVDPSKKPS